MRDGRLPNYEDYFSCLKQFVQDETCEIVNPLIAKNAEALRSAAASLYLEISAISMTTSSLRSQKELRI